MRGDSAAGEPSRNRRVPREEGRVDDTVLTSDTHFSCHIAFRSIEGKTLRLKQQYTLCSASLQEIIARFEKRSGGRGRRRWTRGDSGAGGDLVRLRNLQN